MIIKNWLLFKLTITLIVLVNICACGGGGGGGSSNSTTTYGVGYFIDDPVSGLSYSCGTGTSII